MSEVELAKAAQNSAASLGALLERHGAALYALALRILGRGSEAQGAVQDAFVVALSSIERLCEPEAAGGWLRGILRNVCLIRLGEMREEVPFEERAYHLAEKSIEPSAEEAIDRLYQKTIEVSSATSLRCRKATKMSYTARRRTASKRPSGELCPR